LASCFRTIKVEPSTGTDPQSRENKNGVSQSGEKINTENNGTPTWREFTQNTTCHGIKYVFEDTGLHRK